MTVTSTDTLVIESTSSKVRTFLYELAEGTSNYRSLHSLTEQVEHQYHGRFIVELIQNAHDALLPPAGIESGQTSRIEIALKDEGKFGTLYVANDGQPFSVSNFNSLSQLGQSDKNPQESIGNKGIGFRSVLEITEAPEIYSRSMPNSPGFDGFNFAFSPEVIRRLTAPVLALLNGDDASVSPFGNVPLVDWDARLLAKFRASVTRIAGREKLTAEVWLAKELTYLSPYLLPFPPNGRAADTFVLEFESRGFATLIRFPLKNAATLELVREKLKELDELDGALLFLEKTTSLVLDSGDQRRELSRLQVKRPGSQLNGREVSISEDSNDRVRRYWVWKHDIALVDAPEDVQDVVKQLPGKWPQLQEVSVSIAVSLGETPEAGTLSIFLPTFLPTGSATHVNAPFFGDMSRTHIDFDNAYNRFLSNEAAALAVRVAVNELANRGEDEARAIVDLLSPWPLAGQVENIWINTIERASERLEVNLQGESLFLSDTGDWTPLNNIALLPQTEAPSVLTQEVLRTYATFKVLSRHLNGRRQQLMALASRYFDSGILPLPEWLSETLEAIAVHHHSELGVDYDWNGFWIDADDLFKGDFSALVGKRVLLGNDNQLHAGGDDNCTVFFIPRQSASDDEEVENDGDVKEIPLSLRPFVAFLSERIQVYEEKNGRLQQTRVRKLLLDSKLVSRFRREDILNDVLIARTPVLPVQLTSSDADICRDILLWALRLMVHLIERGKGEKSLRLLKDLPAPCKGGWYPLAETAFGPGWPGTQGDVTQNYLTLVGTTETREASKRLLQPPGNEGWAGNGTAHIGLLRLVGVFDGLRLVSIDPNSWSSRFTANRISFQLPANRPPGWTESDWDEYRVIARNHARPTYNFGTYEIQRLYVFPGLDKYKVLDKDARIAMMEVVLGSACHWDEGWDRLSIHRVVGNWDNIPLLSPLAHCLRELPWLGLENGDIIEWSRPADRWYVPALELARGRKWQFSHLRPLPGELANRLDVDARLAEVMRRLGTPRFDPETRNTSTQLLDALADAVVREEVPHWDVFLGQVRSAWRGFDPTGGSAFPKMLLVQRGSSRLIAESPDEEHPVYLPDSAKSFLAALKHFELPVIAIETEDAKRLADRFTAAFPESVLRASALKPVPLVGGEPWNDTPQDRLRDSTELEWVIPVLLTVAAFHGSQAQGTASKSFRKQLETFRDVRLDVVGKVETGLFRGETPVAPPMPVPALWLSGSQTLLLSDGWRSDMASLSEALATVLDREDLEVPIKLILGITGGYPRHQDVVRALEQLKLSEGHFRDVQEHWRGDLGQIIEMLVPLLTILKTEANIGELVELDTDDAVTEFLDRLGDDRFDGKSIVQMARDSTDMFDFGSKAFVRFGDAVQMSKWNAALSLRNERPLVNSDAPATFKAHFAASAQVLRSLLAAIVARRADIGSFKSLSEQFEALVCPEAYQSDYWDVSFSLALSVAIPLLEQWQATSEEIAAVRESATIDELIDRLTASGVDVGFDPIEAARDNREQLRRALLRLQQIGLAWALESGYPNPADWESRVENYLDNLSAYVEVTIFTRVWSEQDIWELLRELPVDGSSSAFWSSVAAASSLDDLIVRLGLSNEALSTANIKLDTLREDARRRKKVVEVCGKEFDGSEDNLSGLWTHICSGLPTEDLSELEPVNLKKLSSLEYVAARSKIKLKEREPTNKPKQKHLSKSMENLIGLSGEIHAFRMFQCTYGASTVSASSWVSGNSAFVFPDNKTDDGKGCDFVVALQNCTYFIEVKSSESDQENFTLGSSEIRLAMGLTKKSRSRRKETFLVLRVSNALTATPSFQLLPNPYDQKYQSLFVIEEADARVRYRRSPSPHLPARIEI